MRPRALRRRSRASADHADGGKPARSKAAPRRALPPVSSPEDHAVRPEIGLPAQLTTTAAQLRRDLGSGNVIERIDRSVPESPRDRGRLPMSPQSSGPGTMFVPAGPYQ